MMSGLNWGKVERLNWVGVEECEVEGVDRGGDRAVEWNVLGCKSVKRYAVSYAF